MIGVHLLQVFHPQLRWTLGVILVEPVVAGTVSAGEASI